MNSFDEIKKIVLSGKAETDRERIILDRAIKILPKILGIVWDAGMNGSDDICYEANKIIYEITEQLRKLYEKEKESSRQKNCYPELSLV